MSALFPALARVFVLTMATGLLPASGLDLKAGQQQPVTWQLRLVAGSPDLARKEVYAHDPAAEPAAPLESGPLENKLPGRGFHAVSGSGKFVLTTSKERHSLKDPLLRLGEVTMPENTRSAIIVFANVKDPKPEATCAVVAVDDSPQKFPGGSLLTVNATTVSARFRLEEKDYSYQPGESGVIGVPPKGDGKAFKFSISFKEQEGWTTRGAGMMPLPGKNRGLAVFQWDDKRSYHSFKRFLDPVVP